MNLLFLKTNENVKENDKVEKLKGLWENSGVVCWIVGHWIVVNQIENQQLITSFIWIEFCHFEGNFQFYHKHQLKKKKVCCGFFLNWLMLPSIVRIDSMFIDLWIINKRRSNFFLRRWNFWRRERRTFSWFDHSFNGSPNEILLHNIMVVNLKIVKAMKN